MQKEADQDGSDGSEMISLGWSRYLPSPQNDQ